MAESVITFEESPYIKYFGLDHNPFPVAPDTHNFYTSDHIDQILTNIIHGIMARKGFMVLTGDIGLGKTTISRRIINSLEKKGVETSLVFHTAYQYNLLLKEINRDFGLDCQNSPFGDQMNLLREFLLAQSRQGKNCAIIIDDAQNLDHKSLELVRLISNLEADQQKLVQILLIGQPELNTKLNSHKLRQLKSRVIINEKVKPLTLPELKNYLFHKLNLSGNKGNIYLQKQAVKIIHKLTQGNFRQINKIMDRCLYVASFHNTSRISRRIVFAAQKDLEYESNSSHGRRNEIKYWLAAAVLPVVVLGCLYMFKLYPEWPDQLTRKLSGNVLQTAASLYKPMDKAPKKALISRSRMALDAEDSPIIPFAVLEFLKAHELAQYAAKFYQALNDGQLNPLAEEILAQTGNQLIQLDKVPEYIRGEFGILTYPVGNSQQDSHFLFWRPTLQFSNFSISYEGHDILQLQEKLAKLNFFPDPVDGKVSVPLMNAVIKFQKQVGLPVTGFPDGKTLFMLSELEIRIQS